MADKLEREIPHARKIVFPGTAHLLPMELSARFNEVVLNFLNEALA
jgi:pimeloyl-ACP methyl ester carboxylesterase